MGGASIEATLELWASSLRDVKARVRRLFTQERVAASAGLFLDGLLGEERRKTGWMRAEAAGDPGPWRQQAILGRGRWNADDLRDIVRDYALETLADDDAVLVIDENRLSETGQSVLRRGPAMLVPAKAGIPDLQGRSPTARWASLLVTCRGMAIALSIERCICRRRGRTIRPA